MRINTERQRAFEWTSDIEDRAIERARMLKVLSTKSAVKRPKRTWFQRVREFFK